MENLPSFRELDAQYVMPAFTRDMMITRGSGSTVWDSEGKEYIVKDGDVIVFRFNV